MSQKWDHVIDLGRSGALSYTLARERFQCPVTPLSDFRESFGEMRRVRELMASGNGRLIDQFGLDWWELTAIFIHEELERIILLAIVALRFDRADEVCLTRLSAEAEILRTIFGARFRTFPSVDNTRQGHAIRYASALKKFPAAQLLEIFWDKFDPGYQLRSIFNTKRQSSSSPVVLLPSAYVNVSRTATEYARAVPDGRFLLVATRRSGMLRDVPGNVSVSWLSHYSSFSDHGRKAEYGDLMARWLELRNELTQVREFEILCRIRGFDDFPRRFRMGLQIRDAWRNVFQHEPVQAVICADDSNPYTHIPLLLAKNKGLPTVSCHHGALDGRYMFKRTHADASLAKGDMEHDYLVRVCRIPSHNVEIGAPPGPMFQAAEIHPSTKPSIVFFSEAYEVASGRAEDFYRDILPPLANLALAGRRELICKLHPAESVSERSGFLREILSPEQQAVTRIVAGPLNADLLNRAWFGITVMSTVAVECALRGVPCFLCSWLEAWPYGYVDQFTRFGAGIRLSGPEEIEKIPITLHDWQPSSKVRSDCWSPIEPKRLQALLGFGGRPVKGSGRQPGRMEIYS